MTLAVMLAAIPLSVGAIGQKQDIINTSRSWKGQNGWEILYTENFWGGGGFGCSLNWDPDGATHRLLWTWDGVMLMSEFMAPAPASASLGLMNEPSSINVSVDGRPLIAGIRSGTVVKTSSAMLMFIGPMHVAWDHNNTTIDSGPETDDVFDVLRHGRILTINAYDRTYKEDLSGVGSALDHFGECMKYLQNHL